MLLTIIVLVLLVSLLFGGLGHSRFGPAGWSPAAVVLVVLLILWLTGWRGFR